MRRIGIAIALIVLSASAGWCQSPGEKYALLVGVRRYDPNELRSLPYAEADVEAMARVFLENGYRPENVVVMTQKAGAEDLRLLPTADRIRKQLALLVADRAAEDSVIVAFAGHGVQFRGEDQSYFCPADAALENKATLLSLGEIYDLLKQCPAGFKLLLVDACRNDPVSRNSRARETIALESVTRPQNVAPPGGVVAMFSCSSGEEAFEHPGLKHGVFFNFVLQALDGDASREGSDGVTFPELEYFVKKRVNDFVRAEYSKRQMPEVVGSSRGLVPLVTFDRARVAYRSGMKLAAAGKPEDAIARFNEAIGLKPMPRAYFERGLARSKLHNDVAALDDFNQAIQRGLTEAPVYTARGEAYRLTHQLDRAIADCNEAIRLDSRLALAYARRARVITDLANRARLEKPELTIEYQRAIADCNKAIELDPKNAIAFLNRGIANKDKGDTDRAIADFNEAIRLDPENAPSFNSRGLAYRAKGDSGKAIADFNEAIRLDPKYAVAYNNRGLAYEKSDPDKAIADFSEAIRLDPRYAVAYNNRGIAYKAKGDLDSAIANYHEAIRLNPKYALAHLNRGLAYRAKGDTDRAIVDYSETIRLDPRNAAVYYDRGNAYRAKGDLDRAITDYSEAIRLDPKNAFAYINRGIAHKDRRAFDSAIADYNEAVRLDPKNAVVFHNRGLVFKAKGDSGRAIADYSEAIRLNPRYTAAYNNRGLVYKDKRDFDKAIADYNEAIRIDPKYALAYKNRGNAYKAKGDTARADKDFATARSLAPTSKR